MRKGSVVQRHNQRCPRDADGTLRPHRCRGSWAYALELERFADGRRRQISKAGFPTRRAAERALREVLEREDAELVHLHGLTTGDYLRQWLDAKHSLRATTKASYESHLRLYLVPQIGHVPLVALRPQHLDRMYAGMVARPDGRLRAAATVRRVHATLRSALNSAVKRRLIAWNPAVHIELPSAATPRTVVWTPAELEVFLEANAGHRLYALFHLVAVAGLRRGEVLGLSWDDVDLERRFIRIRRQLLDTAGASSFGPPKTRHGIRTVPLDDATVDVLRDHRDQQQAEARRARAAGLWTETGLVFTREDGRCVRPDFVTKEFPRLIQLAALPPIRLHDLRHTSASLALAAGVPMKVVSERLGHSSLSITADLYTHVSPVVAYDAADRIGALVHGRRRTSQQGPDEPAP